MATQTKIGTQQALIDQNLQALDYWGWYNATATLGNNKHGDTGPSFFLNEGYGDSASVLIGTQYKPDGTPYDFRVLARIDKISNSDGSIAGGLDIVIDGAGFPSDSSLYKINVDGAPCALKTIVSEKQIICTTSAKSNPSVPSNSSVFLGNAGLVREYWGSNSNFKSLIGIVPPISKTVLANAQLPNYENPYTRSRIYGLFVAPVSGNYIFSITADDGAQVFLSTDNTEANKTSIINLTYNTQLKQRLIYADSISDPVTLTANTSYYLEIQHYQGAGNSFLDLGVQMPGNGKNKLPFIQNITFGPQVLVREVQKLKIGVNALPTGGTLKLRYGSTSLDPVD